MSENISNSNPETNEASSEYLTGVLAVTREQLSRAMGVCAELEALVNLERQKSQQYEQVILELQKQLNESKPETDTKK